MIRIVIKIYWHFRGGKAFVGTEEYLVPKDTTRPSQHRSATRYVNRQLPLGHRTRGDVGLI
jgi:hypothetical protein